MFHTCVYSPRKCIQNVKKLFLPPFSRTKIPLFPEKARMYRQLQRTRVNTHSHLSYSVFIFAYSRRKTISINPAIEKGQEKTTGDSAVKKCSSVLPCSSVSRTTINLYNSLLRQNFQIDFRIRSCHKTDFPEFPSWLGV